MKWFPRFGFQRRKRELQEEIDAHLQMAIADRVARGETPESARQAAEREFGNIPLVQDVTRDMWGQASIDQLGRDLRYALRQLRKSPGFTITATTMLAVAICANSTVFSWIDGTMLRPIPGARDTGDLVSLNRGERNFSPTPPFSYLDYRDLCERNHTFAGILAYHHDWITLTGGAQPERVYIANVSANYFDVLGIKPMLGRFFLPEEDSRAVPNVVLGYSLWKTRYAKDPAIVGKSIEIARHPVTVIGVAPEGVVGAMPGIREDLWVTLDPLGTCVADDASQWWCGLAERNRKVAARREPWPGSPGPQHPDAQHCGGVSGRSSGREPDHAGSHVALAIRRQRIHGGDAAHSAGLRRCGAVADLRERGDAHAGAVCSPAA